MATDKQIAANRRNALKSTGPRTEEGKATIRFNALEHGIRAHFILLPGEDRDTFEKLRNNLDAEWQPVGATETFYLEQMLSAQWKLRRVDYFEHAVYHAITDPMEQFPKLLKLWQEQHRLERSFNKAQHELERLQAARQERDAAEAKQEAVEQPLPPANPEAVQQVEQEEPRQPLRPALIIPQAPPLLAPNS